MRDSNPAPWIACVLCMIGALALGVAAWVTGLPFLVASLGRSP